MGALIVRLIALTLVLAATVCIGVMFVGGFAVMIELGRGGEPGFDAMVARIRELRMWGIVGIGMFLLALGLLWFLPDRRTEDEAED